MMNVMGYGQKAYKKVCVETANPGQLLVQLYDAAIRFVDEACGYIDAKDAKGKGESLRKAHAIISEFINSLDHSVAPDLCANLEAVYGFMLDQIADANLNMSKEPLLPVLEHLRVMRDAWQQAVSEVAVQGATAQAAGGRVL